MKIYGLIIAALLTSGCAGMLSDLGLTKAPSIEVPAASAAIAWAELNYQAGRLIGSLDTRCDPEMSGRLKADARTCAKLKMAEPMLRAIKATVDDAMRTMAEKPDVNKIIAAVAQMIAFAASLMP